MVNNPLVIISQIKKRLLLVISPANIYGVANASSSMEETISNRALYYNKTVTPDQVRDVLSLSKMNMGLIADQKVKPYISNSSRWWKRFSIMGVIIFTKNGVDFFTGKCHLR
jgi:hypothetical protein